ncbi:FMN-linked oxidoreductase [Backusella circina FSU 941]|nr:FMN-linked oxidoreductase [Backusella circina FSU 941]
MVSTAVQKSGENVSPPIGELKSSNGNVPKMFTPITCRSVTLKNRIVVPPMCMYSCQDGFFNDFHLTHYGSFALKGVGMVIIEATAVEPQGRISPNDCGLWSDDHIPGLKRIADLIRSQGAVPSIQLAHAGRKASMGSGWCKGGYHLVSEEDGGWPNDVRGPSDIPFDEVHALPRALNIDEMKAITQKWVDAAIRADKAGIEVLEIHSAHGYYIHNFLSGNSNKRTDQYGGSLENRLRHPLEIVQAVRDVWPDHKPLWLRFSGTDFKNPDTLGSDPEGWDVIQATEYAKKLKEIGVDVIDVSSGGNLPRVRYPVSSLYQVPLSKYVRDNADIQTGAVGYITSPKEGEGILQNNEADYVLVGREHLRNAGWTNRAANELDVTIQWANQYTRAQKESIPRPRQ